MSDKIKDSYRQTRNIYDDVLTRSKWWSRLYMDVFWGGIDDNEIAAKTLSFIPDIRLAHAPDPVPERVVHSAIRDVRVIEGKAGERLSLGGIP